MEIYIFCEPQPSVYCRSRLHVARGFRLHTLQNMRRRKVFLSRSKALIMPHSLLFHLSYVSTNFSHYYVLGSVPVCPPLVCLAPLSGSCGV